MKTIFTFIVLLFTSAGFAQTTNNQGTPEISLSLSAKPKQKIDNFVVALEIKNISGKPIRMIDTFDEPDDGYRSFFGYNASYGLETTSPGGLLGRRGAIYRYKIFKPGETLRLKFTLSKWRGRDFFRPNEDLEIYMRYSTSQGEDCVKGLFTSNRITVRLEK